jgi:peptide/nickel transport system substrate-binding protein
MASVEATDATHVVLHSKQPTSLYAGNYLYTFLLPQHIWDNLPQGMRPKQFENVPAVGSGPYTIAEYKTGQYVRLEKNPEWNGPQPAIDEIIVQYYKSEDAMAEALKAGEIDFAYFTSANIFNSVKSAPNVGTMVGAVPSFDEIGMNSGSSYQPKTASYTPHGDGHPALTDVKVRQAIRMAISSKELSDKVFLGYAQPGDTIVPPISVAGMRWAPTGDQVLAWSIDAANKLLEDAGYKDCDNDGVREMPGCKQPSLDFRYFVRTSDQTTVDAAPFVQKWLEQIGIKANVEAMSSGRLGDIINAGEYDLFDWGWYPDPDPDSQLSYFTCDQRPPDGHSYGNNDGYFCNAEYDKMYQQQHTELDPQKRIEIIHQMQQLYYEQSPYAVKWYSPLLQGYRTDTFTGYVPQPQPQGDLLDGYTYKGMLSIRPIGAGGTGSHTTGISPAVWLGIILGLIIVIAGIVLARRSRSSDEDVA